MASSHPARESDLLWDYPEKTPGIVGALAIAACLGICALLLRVASVHELLFGGALSTVFLLASTDIMYFLIYRIPPRPRALTDGAGHDGVVPKREQRKREAEHRAWRHSVAKHETNLLTRRATQRTIRVCLVGAALGFVLWLVRAQTGFLPDLMLKAELALWGTVIVACFVAAWPAITSPVD